MYKKVIINGPEDLPKESGEYIAAAGKEIAFTWYTVNNSSDETDWVNDVDWYLKSIEQPEINMPTEEEVNDIIKGNAPHTVNEDGTETTTFWFNDKEQHAAKLFAEWFKSEILKRNVEQKTKH